MVQLKSVYHFPKALFPCLIFTFVWAFLVEPSLYEHNTELWSLRPMGGITKGMLQKFDMFVKIKSKIAFPLDGRVRASNAFYASRGCLGPTMG
jgi:hypothetical protein